MDLLCQRSFMQRDGSCPAPCRVSTQSGMRQTCRGPPQLPMVKVRQPPGSEFVNRILVDMMSATLLYQHRCQAPARQHPAQCMETVTVCDREKHNFGKEGDGLVDHIGPAAALPGPGFKGVLQKAVHAMAAGKSAEFFDDYLENNPETITNLTSKALQSLSEYFHEKPGTAPMPAAPPAQAAPPAPTSQGSDVPFEEVSDAPKREDLPPLPDLAKAGVSESLRNPWVIAAGAAALAISCSGIAMGALCHAQLLTTQAREPLLDASGGGASLATPHQEMEHARFTPPTVGEA